MTTNLAETRRSLVQSLRKLAKTCKVPVEKLPKDTAGRQKVQALAATVAASAGPEDAKEQFSAEFLTYEKTWEPEPEEEAEAEDDEGGEYKTYRLRGKSFLFTYNWDFFGTALPDNTAAFTSPEALWSAWKTFKAAKKKEMEVTHSTSTLEQSLDSPTEDRVHFHWKVDCRQALDEGIERFAFHGVKPDARTTFVTAASKQARGANQAEASNRGHFYCWAPKKGTLYTAKNWKPWKDYRVRGSWLAHQYFLEGTLSRTL